MVLGCPPLLFLLRILTTLCSGIYEEAKKWVKPFVSNQKLKEAFMTYTKPPRTYERLNDLSAYVSIWVAGK